MEEERKEGLVRLGILETLSSGELQEQNSDGDEDKLSKDAELGQLPIKRALLMATLYVALYLPTLNQTVVSTALPKILSDINKFGSDIGYTWVGSAYALAQAMALPLFGQLGHAPGKKWALLTAMTIFILGSILCGTAVNIQMLLAARTIQGIGAGGISGLVFVLLADMARVKGVGKYNELVGAFSFFFSTVAHVFIYEGPLVGGSLAEMASWRWCFFMNLPICALCTITICILLPQSNTTATVRGAVRLFDLWGVTAIGIGKVLVTLAFQWVIQNEAWTSPPVLATLISGIVALVGFFPAEMSAESPVLPLGVFHHRTRIGAYIAIFFHSVAFSGLNYWLPMYFQAVRQQTASESGLRIHLAGVLGGERYVCLLDITCFAVTSVLLVLAGLGVGPNFNSPLFPIHASFDISDGNYAAVLSQSTSAYAFLRSLGSSIGISASGLVFFEDLAQHQLPSLSVFNLTQAIEYSDLLSKVEEHANVEVLHMAMQHVFIQVCICMGVGLFLSLLIGRHKFSNELDEDEDELPRGVPRVDSFGTEDG
ncbi:putative Major facilitator superfamily domain-containing protein [Seiridium unicorne]|uniref:Major facilitator superfamily domain-containing protein n=1 Tax=Seiridium unicorne TaxID=138068 RepID=A0ABR2UNV9_9PEZI